MKDWPFDESFDELYEKYYWPVFRCVLKILLDWHLAEDAARDAFVALPKMFAEYQRHSAA